MTNLKEIAARCGCSVATVSKALNGLPDINVETAVRIRKIAEEMGYVPNTAARTLRTNRSHTIGLLWFLKNESIWQHDHFGRIAAAIQQITDQAGYSLTPIDCNSIMPRRNYLNYCRNRGYDGVIIMSAGFHEDGLLELINKDLPVVTLDYSFPEHSSVSSDHTVGMESLVRYAYSMGHRKIAYIHGESESTVTGSRLGLFLDTARRLGLQVPAEYLQEIRYRDIIAAGEKTGVLLALNDRPTCILYSDDIAALGGIREIRLHGYRIPRDISVAGYDGLYWTKMMLPQLTTVYQDCDAIGQYAGREILKAIARSADFEPQHIDVPTKLLLGGTIGDIR